MLERRIAWTGTDEEGNIVSGQTPTNVNDTVPNPDMKRFNFSNGLWIPAGERTPANTGRHDIVPLAQYQVVNGDFTPQTGVKYERMYVKGQIKAIHNDWSITYLEQEYRGAIGGIRGSSTQRGNGWKISKANIRGIMPATTVEYNDAEAVAIIGSGCTLEDVVISGFADGIVLADNMIVRKVVVHTLWRASGGHIDCFQYASSDDSVVEDFTAICFDQNASAVKGSDGVYTIKGGTSNSPFQMGSNNGTVYRNKVRNGYVSGGGYHFNANRTREATNGYIDVDYSDIRIGGLYWNGVKASTPRDTSFSNLRYAETLKWRRDDNILISVTAGQAA